MPIPDISADVGTTNPAESRQRGDLTRENRFRGEMSVRIMEIDARTELLYTSSGNLGKPLQSMVARVLSIFWP